MTELTPELADEVWRMVDTLCKRDGLTQEELFAKLKAMHEAKVASAQGDAGTHAPLTRGNGELRALSRLLERTALPESVRTALIDRYAWDIGLR